MESRPLETEGTEPRTTEHGAGTTARLDEDRIADDRGDLGTGNDGRDESQALSTEDLVAAEPESTTESATVASSESTEDNGEHTLFDDTDVERFRDSWQGIQTAFVDDPRRAVKEADELVAVVIQNLASTFADHKKELESAWSQGEPATEDLRIALRRYRSFFNQLLRA